MYVRERRSRTGTSEQRTAPGARDFDADSIRVVQREVFRPKWAFATEQRESFDLKELHATWRTPDGRSRPVSRQIDFGAVRQ